MPRIVSEASIDELPSTISDFLVYQILSIRRDVLLPSSLDQSSPSILVLKETHDDCTFPLAFYLRAHFFQQENLTYCFKFFFQVGAGGFCDCCCPPVYQLCDVWGSFTRGHFFATDLGYSRTSIESFKKDIDPISPRYNPND